MRRENLKSEFLYGDLTYKLNGILFAAHNELGRFAREKQYAECIAAKLKEKGINYQRELIVSDSGNIIDFLIEGTIILELKAKPFLTKEDYYQIKRYLQVCNLKLGILVNFRSNYLNPKRILHPLQNP